MGSFKISDQDFQEKVLDSTTPVVVDFYADWCGPCRIATPVIEEIAEEYEGKLVVVKVNIDEDAELAARYQVMSIPTVLLFKDGQEIDRIIGFGGKEKYLQAVKKVI